MWNKIQFPWWSSMENRAIAATATIHAAPFQTVRCYITYTFCHSLRLLRFNYWAGWLVAFGCLLRFVFSLFVVVAVVKYNTLIHIVVALMMLVPIYFTYFTHIIRCILYLICSLVHMLYAICVQYTHIIKCSHIVHI